MQILCKIDYIQEILTEEFQFVEEESLNKNSRVVHRFQYRGLKYLFDKYVFSDYDQNRNLVEHLLEDKCRCKEENSKLNACQKKLVLKKKNVQYARKLSDLFGRVLCLHGCNR